MSDEQMRKLLKEYLRAWDSFNPRQAHALREQIRKYVEKNGSSTSESPTTKPDAVQIAVIKTERC